MKKLLVTSLLSTLILTACGTSDDNQAPHAANKTPDTNQGIELKSFAASIENSYVDMADVKRISRFRSSVGHSYTDNFESCRSMKHYLDLSKADAQIVSPVDGSVESITDEQSGKGVQIEILHETDVKNHVMVVKLFHVAKDGLTIKQGDEVKANEILGHHAGADTYSDIAVELITPKKGVTNPDPDKASDWDIHLESWFKLMEPALLTDLGNHYGISGNVYISAEERDKAPLTCSGEQFNSEPKDSLSQWIDVKHN